MSESCAICTSLGPWSEGARWTVAEVKEALAQVFGGEERIPGGSYADAIRELGRRLDLMGYPKPSPETERLDQGALMACRDHCHDVYCMADYDHRCHDPRCRRR